MAVFVRSPSQAWLRVSIQSGLYSTHVPEAPGTGRNQVGGVTVLVTEAVC